ncbi:MAG: DUF4870 domain-containing protein [Micrococcales bacterium]|nr:DUF4870 domain-containing protein [Micrococcales bacterium]
MTDTPPPPAAPAAAAPLSAAEDKQWAGIAHLGGIIGILPSLIIWLVFKDRGALTNREGKEALNFQITLVIVVVAYSILNAILTVVTFGIWTLIGWLPYLAVWVLDIVWSILGFSKVNAGGSYRYPLTIRLIK